MIPFLFLVNFNSAFTMYVSPLESLAPRNSVEASTDPAAQRGG